MIALFSGRFDRVHAGHIIQIQRLGKIYDLVQVPILDYSEQKYPIEYRLEVLREAMYNSKGQYYIFPNKIHFAKATKEYLQSLEFDVYCSGNMECLKNVAAMGFKIQYCDPVYGYAASESYLLDKVRAII